MKNRSMCSFFKTSGNVNLLSFGTYGDFNGAFGESVRRCHIDKDFNDSCKVHIELENSEPIDQFKLTNQNLLTWDDYWIDSDSGKIIDPMMKSVNLQRNDLVYVNMSLHRDSLESLNLEGNNSLQHLYIHSAPKLSSLIIDNCTSLRYICLGENRSLTHISAKNCGLSSDALEQLLRDFRPTIAYTRPITGAGLFRKAPSTLLDLRGNVIDWSNRKISSKIRLLLTNHWEVRWDNPPPTDIIPLRMYSFPVESRIALN